jgi:hypothetical protein
LWLLPIWQTFHAGSVSFSFSLNNQDQVTFDSVFDNLVTGRGTNKLTLR